MRLKTEQEYQELIQRMSCPTLPVLSPPMPAKRARHAMPDTGGMNKLEALYAREVLDIRQMGGEILGWKFEAIKLRLAKKTFYTPDFMVVYADHIEIHETKGHWEDDARVKIKVAAEMFREFRFTAIQRKKGIWIYEEIKVR